MTFILFVNMKNITTIFESLILYIETDIVEYLVHN